MADGVKLNKVNYNGKGKFLEWIYDFHATCRYLDQRKADVAISFLSRCNFMLILAGLMSRTKVIVCDRNNLYGNILNMFFKSHASYIDLRIPSVYRRMR